MTDINATVTLPVLDKRVLLLQSRYFADLSTEYLERIEELMVEECFERDDMIFNEGDGNRYLYLVASGAAKIFGTSADGKEQILELSRPGDSFNDVAAFDGGANPVGAQALTPLVVYRLSGQVLLDRSCDYGPLAANIVRGLAKRVRELGDLVADLSFRPVVGRLAKILLEQLPHAGSAKLTQKDMAAMAGTAREVVARALKSLEEEGIIRTERQRIVILDRTALEKLTI
ncbi:Crp/Fnr family transcriptional regulator [Dehalogenimonas sp. THU2]|uniref:Crp/Fnr family transcriptional regulator n=1 Tax=Dehalogenimonas sp. THU2 TaxID=3151121 RepID=UPI003218131D